MRGSGFSSMRALKASPIRSWSPDSICRCCSHPENRALECDHVHIQRCIGTWNVLFAILCELIFSSVESSPRDFDYCPKSRISQQSVALKLKLKSVKITATKSCPSLLWDHFWGIEPIGKQFRSIRFIVRVSLISDPAYHLQVFLTLYLLR